eukprot:2588173-Amphidinium_carterae.1
MADSGAMRSVCTPLSFSDVSMSKERIPQLHSITGERLNCHGIKEIDSSVGSALCKVKLTVADVSKSVMSLPEIADQGFTIVLCKDHSYVTTVTPEAPHASKREDLQRVNGLWYFLPQQQQQQQQPQQNL